MTQLGMSARAFHCTVDLEAVSAALRHAVHMMASGQHLPSEIDRTKAEQ